ncbi:MAG TPA: PDDEXK nuclease domain-containing protein [Bryobacteraceae bacterium]|nr:PDDEXK nuclease domain-containing protein [Bryobacteraceae bacterium]
MMPAERMGTEITRNYNELLSGILMLLEQGRQLAARSVNAVLTTTYWLVGQRLVEHEQGGEERAAYGSELLKRLSRDLQSRLGRGFSERNLEHMRQFYLGWPIPQTLSANSSVAVPPNISQTLSAKLNPSVPAAFPLSWSHYVRLLSVFDPEARRHYEVEALRGGWSVRQLDRQISTLAYQRSGRGVSASGEVGEDAPVRSPESEIKDPFVLEFLGLKDEYSEAELEEALIRELEQFLLELGNDFAFIARQKRLRVGNEWYRVDLLFFHRRLRSLIVAELKLGRFTHADAGQMNLYLNYAREHWTNPDENPPIGLILCSEHDVAVAHYALGNLGNQVLAREYQLNLPTEEQLTRRLEARRKQLER